jgi:hypothetical protein
VAGTEAGAVGLQYEDLDLVVAVGQLQGLVHVPHLLGRLDVGLLGDVQDDPGHGPVLFVHDRLE